MLLLPLRALIWLLRLPLAAVRGALVRLRPRPFELHLNLDGAHPEHFAGGRPWGAPVGISRAQLRWALRKAEADPRVQKLVIRVGHLAGGWAEVQSIRDVVLKARARGLAVEAFVAHPDLRALWLASAAQQVVLAPHVPVEALGVGASLTFFGPLLESVGIDVEVLAAGAFKSAMEPLVRDRPSPANREATQALVGDLSAQVLGDIAASRNLSPEAVRAAIDAMPLSAAQAVERGLADTLASEDERAEAAEADERRALNLEDYRGRPGFVPRWRKRASRLALVRLHGTIRDGRHDDPTGGPATTAAFCAAVDRARTDKRVRGVLLSIDSPGGSATASERMYQAVRRLAAKKPVVALMGDAAASGGYYVAAAAHHIVSAPATFTGSIGVIAARPTVARLLHRIGIARVRIDEGAHAGLYDLGRPLTASQRAALQATVAAFYETFIARVATGRSMDPAAVEAVAGGRVWTGAQALEHQLVDALGHFDDAVATLAERVGVKVPEALRLIQAPMSFVQKMRVRLGLARGATTHAGLALAAWQALTPPETRLRTEAPELLRLHAETAGRPLALCPWSAA